MFHHMFYERIVIEATIWQNLLLLVVQIRRTDYFAMTCVRVKGCQHTRLDETRATEAHLADDVEDSDDTDEGNAHSNNDHLTGARRVRSDA
jgi:hypothetical protein